MYSKNPEVIQTMFNLELQDMADKYGCRVSTKAQGRWFWKILDGLFWLLRGGKKSDFMRRATTIGPFIAYPETTNLNNITALEYVTFTHEVTHVKQCANLGLGEPILGMIPFLLLYLFVPLPAWRSWFRFRYEREAFLVEYQEAKEFGWHPSVEDYVEALSGPSYLYAWPADKVREWFKKELG